MFFQSERTKCDALETANRVFNAKKNNASVHLLIDVCLIVSIAVIVGGSVAVFFFK